MAEKILIVEDEEKISRFIELELIHEGYDVSKPIMAGMVLRWVVVEILI